MYQFSFVSTSMTKYELYNRYLLCQTQVESSTLAIYIRVIATFPAPEKESLQERVDNLEKMLVMMAEKVGVDASMFGLALPPSDSLPRKSKQ